MKKHFGRSELLEGIHSVPCDLHNEQKGSSFHWNTERRSWRCYGKCGTGGNIVDLCMKATGTRDREEAIGILLAEFSISDNIYASEDKLVPTIKEEDREYRSLYNQLIRKAKTTEDYLNMDYAMSFHVDTKERIKYLRKFCLGEDIHLAGYEKEGLIVDDTEFNEY